jgi:hypothetical protein
MSTLVIPKSKTPVSDLKTFPANVLIATAYYCTHMFSITQEEFNDQQLDNFVKKKSDKAASFTAEYCYRHADFESGCIKSY